MRSNLNSNLYGLSWLYLEAIIATDCVRARIRLIRGCFKRSSHDAVYWIRLVVVDNDAGRVPQASCRFLDEVDSVVGRRLRHLEIVCRVECPAFDCLPRRFVQGHFLAGRPH
jgi:hypothetical protein